MYTAGDTEGIYAHADRLSAETDIAKTFWHQPYVGQGLRYNFGEGRFVSRKHGIEYHRKPTCSESESPAGSGPGIFGNGGSVRA